jgi:hypothetical protein
MTPQSPAGAEIRRAAADAVIAGLHEHGPDAVGIVLKGIPLAGLAAVAHYLLAVPSTASGLGSATIAALYVSSRRLWIRKLAIQADTRGVPLQ